MRFTRVCVCVSVARAAVAGRWGQRHVVEEPAGVRALKRGYSFPFCPGKFISMLARYGRYSTVLERSVCGGALGASVCGALSECTSVGSAEGSLSEDVD